MGRLFRSLFLLTVLATIASAVAAAIAKGRMPSRGEPDDDEVDLVAIFDALEFTSVAPALREARLTTWYGGATLDLRAATLSPDGAVLTIRAAFGGVRIVVPEAWHVEVAMSSVFGGVGDTRSVAAGEVSSAGAGAGAGPDTSPDVVTSPTPGPTLWIEGFAVFGGVGIMSDAPDLDEAELGLPVSLSA